MIRVTGQQFRDFPAAVLEFVLVHQKPVEIVTPSHPIADALEQGSEAKVVAVLSPEPVKCEKKAGPEAPPEMTGFICDRCARKAFVHAASRSVFCTTCGLHSYEPDKCESKPGPELCDYCGRVICWTTEGKRIPCPRDCPTEQKAETEREKLGPESHPSCKLCDAPTDYSFIADRYECSDCKSSFPARLMAKAAQPHSSKK